MPTVSSSIPPQFTVSPSIPSTVHSLPYHPCTESPAIPPPTVSLVIPPQFPRHSLDSLPFRRLAVSPTIHMCMPPQPSVGSNMHGHGERCHAEWAQLCRPGRVHIPLALSLRPRAAHLARGGLTLAVFHQFVPHCPAAEAAERNLCTPAQMIARAGRMSQSASLFPTGISMAHLVFTVLTAPVSALERTRAVGAFHFSAVGHSRFVGEPREGERMRRA